MKKIIVLAGLFYVLTGCDSQPVEDSTATDAQQETIEEIEEETNVEELDEKISENAEIDIEQMIREGMLKDLKTNKRSDLLTNFPDAEIGIKYFPFKPSILVKTDFYLVEVTYKTGDFIEHEDFGVLYSSLEDGSYSSNQYSLMLGDDRPCDMCDILEIDSLPGPTDPFTKFEYRSNGETFEATLSCDLAEMSFYWTRF